MYTHIRFRKAVEVHAAATVSGGGGVCDAGAGVCVGGGGATEQERLDHMKKARGNDGRAAGAWW